MVVVVVVGGGGWFPVILSLNPTTVIRGVAGRGPNRLDLTVGRFFFRSSGKMSSGWETIELT